ncbi:methyl-accepting chemotaxis protein [Vannielia litorea]|uniref:Methyl-accepting chemotaxis sensory transducer with Pas/Pac sensor n=1 Tax=Vannielia litorea TaxID=1217970 RepID=A0A1N6F2K5_9RHOB|nr:methyl-accepting chemotaxis protein [Vannielia litorea]SIN89512.1 methyl-accepting chemotaxis sensory transducer with Pas/Pac sensor [Vannielia litorea]
MALLRNMNLRTKLPLLIFLTVAVTVAGLVGLVTREGLANAEATAVARLGATMEQDRRAVQGWVDQIRADLTTNASEDTVTAALVKLAGAYAALGSDPTGVLQHLYIEANPHPQGEKHNFDFATDGSGYSIAHKRYHGFFRALLQTRGYYDIFLFDADGNLVYTVAKELDFATNIQSGPWAETGLGEAFRGAVDRAGAVDPVMFVDFAPYGPSHGAAAGFAGIAILNAEGQVQGVLAVQMPTNQLTPLLSGSGKGDGAVQVVVTGPDDMPRSLAGEKGIAPVRSEALTRALAGETGQLRGVLSDGTPGLAVYGPVELGAFTWAISAEMKDQHAFGPIRRLITESAIGGAVLLAIATALGFALSRGVVRPINGMERGLEALARGDYATPMTGTDRGDELGQMARSGEALRETLQAARDAERDNIFRGAGFQASSAAMLMLDADLTVTYVNAAMTDFMGRHAAEFSSNGLHDGDADITGLAIDRLMPNPESLRRAVEEPEGLPKTLFFRLGDTRFAMRVGVVADEDGRTIGTVVELSNATREFMDRALMTTIDKFLSTIKMDRKARIFEVNGTMATVLGRTPEDMVGSTALDIFSFDENLAAQHGNVLERLEKGESVFGLFRLRGADDSSRWLQGGFSPVLDTDGQPAMFLFMGSDITADREKLLSAEQEQLRVAKAQSQVVDGLRVGLTALADGDLTHLIEERFAAEYEELRLNFNQAAGKLCEAIGMVMDNAGAIHREVGEIAASADDLSRRTERQATTLEETAAALDQLTSSVRSAAAGADRANDMVTQARGNAEQGGEVVREAVAAMGQISQSSDQISKIISVIEDIAFQTNLLALNAGVEAARAGEAGRGFAVVASEVRALAQRSSDAAREISSLISSSGDHVKRGVDLVGQTGEALRGIVTSVSDIASHVSEIARSAREQSSGLDEINTAMNQLDQVTQQNAAMFEETNAASQALSTEADTLKSTMSRFRIGDSAAHADAPAISPGIMPASVAPAGAARAVSAAPKPATEDQPARPSLTQVADPGSRSRPAATFRSGRAPQGTAALAVSAADEDWEEF